MVESINKIPIYGFDQELIDQLGKEKFVATREEKELTPRMFQVIRMAKVLFVEGRKFSKSGIEVQYALEKEIPLYLLVKAKDKVPKEIKEKVDRIIYYQSKKELIQKLQKFKFNEKKEKKE